MLDWVVVKDGIFSELYYEDLSGTEKENMTAEQYTEELVSKYEDEDIYRHVSRENIGLNGKPATMNLCFLMDPETAETVVICNLICKFDKYMMVFEALSDEEHVREMLESTTWFRELEIYETSTDYPAEEPAATPIPTQTPPPTPTPNQPKVPVKILNRSYWNVNKTGLFNDYTGITINVPEYMVVYSDEELAEWIGAEVSELGKFNESGIMYDTIMDNDGYYPSVTVYYGEVPDGYHITDFSIEEYLAWYDDAYTNLKIEETGKLEVSVYDSAYRITEYEYEGEIYHNYEQVVLIDNYIMFMRYEEYGEYTLEDATEILK